MANTATPNPNDRVLATLNADGSRRWLRPRLSTGVFWQARRVVAYLLIIAFVVIPYLSINGNPVLRLDIARRAFSFFGQTFLPTDTLLMALLMVTIFVSIFLVTALFGRVWCGWACPQTVYMEFLYRPIERLFDGAPGKKQKIRGSAGLRRAMKYGVYLLCSLLLAHTFLAYFVGPEVWTWMARPPVEHPVAFLVMAAVTGLMMLDFGFFREQVCLVMCPYGRFQAALLDRHSMIVTYDENRGEPRGRQKRRKVKDGDDVHLKVVAEPSGDCVDCFKCVTTCPTGIDIREGLQMECIGCAQCIDACDSVMEKIGKPKGLIRYSSQAVMEGEANRVVRPRTLIYPVVLLVLVSVFVLMLGGRQTADAQVLSRTGATFLTLDDSGLVANQVRMRLVNRSEDRVTYTIAADDQDARILSDTDDIVLAPGESIIHGFQLTLPPDSFGERGVRDTNITVTGSDGFSETLNYRALGPRTASDGGAR